MAGASNARYNYRARVSSTAERMLLAEWDRCRWVWNECVAESKAAHRARTKCGAALLCKKLTGWRAEHAWLAAGAAVPQQQVIRDFGRSRAKALKDIKEKLPVKQRAGMPCYKKKSVALPSLNYTGHGFALRNGNLTLAGGISVTVVWSRPLPAKPSSVRLYRDSLGHWYVSFVVATQVDPLPATGKVIGVDWDVGEIATTTSDLHDLPHPEYGRKQAQKLACFQRQMARRKPERGQKPSAGYRKAKRRTAKAYKKAARQRQDTARKWAKTVARDHDAIAVEDFRSKFLARSSMARKAADAAISATKKALVEMGRKHGREVFLVHPAHTTMDCANCGARAKHRLPLSERIYSCTACGAESPRDKNSARVMLVRAGLNPDGVDRVRPLAPQGLEAA